MESEDHGQGGRQHHCHHHDHPDSKEQRHARAQGNVGRHIHGDVGVLPDKDCPRRCCERQKQAQYDVALKREWIWLAFIHRRISNIQRMEAKDYFDFTWPPATKCQVTTANVRCCAACPITWLCPLWVKSRHV